MLAFILRRSLQAVLVMLVVALLSFSMFRFAGDPVNNMVGAEASMIERAELRETLGLDDPMVVQYARFVGNALTGNLGISYRSQEPVGRLIMARLPATLELTLAAAVLTLLVGIPLGVYTALNRKGVGSQMVQVVSLVGISVPTFVVGILLILVFSVWLRWLPSFGRGETVMLGWWSTGFLTKSGWQALILPAITLSLFQMTLIMRLIRSEMIQVLRADYIRFARARGLRNRAIRFRHALKNTLIPVITITGLQVGSLVAFAITTETVFQWPGMGLLFIQAVHFVDIPVMSAYLILIALIFVMINLIVDVLYFVVDPRLGISSSAHGGG
jgi:peptide/nickel transport system permease protein